MHYKHHDFLFHPPFTNHIVCFRYSMVPAPNSIHFKQCTQCIACFVSQFTRERLKINKTTIYVIWWFPFYQFHCAVNTLNLLKVEKKNPFIIRSMAQMWSPSASHLYGSFVCCYDSAARGRRRRRKEKTKKKN